MFFYMRLVCGFGTVVGLEIGCAMGPLGPLWHAETCVWVSRAADAAH